MDIDRRQFLVLTAAIHASACSGHAPIEPTERDPVDEVRPPIFIERKPGRELAAAEERQEPQPLAPVSTYEPITEEAPPPEEQVHPGLYKRRDGCVDLATAKGPGFGYRVETIVR